MASTSLALTCRRSMLAIMPFGLTPVSKSMVCERSPRVTVSNSDKPCSATGWSGDVPSTIVAVGWVRGVAPGEKRRAGAWSGMNTSKTLSTSVVTVRLSTGSSGIVRRMPQCRSRVHWKSVQVFGLTLCLQADPDKIREYREYHQAVWPEVTARLRECGVQQMQIFLRGT